MRLEMRRRRFHVSFDMPYGVRRACWDSNPGQRLRRPLFWPLTYYPITGILGVVSLDVGPLKPDPIQLYAGGGFRFLRRCVRRAARTAVAVTAAATETHSQGNPSLSSGDPATSARRASARKAS